MAFTEKLQNIENASLCFKNFTDETAHILNKLKKSSKFFQQLEFVDSLCRKIISNRGCLYLMGNGGSAAQASHIAAEVTVRLVANRIPGRAVNLVADQSILTAISNDYKFENIFSRQIESHVGNNDLVMALSTSGESKNIVKAAMYCSEKNLKIISLTKEGSTLSKFSKPIEIPQCSTTAMQHIHSIISHVLCEGIEKSLMKN